MIASKLIRRNLSPDDNRALIDEVIGSVGEGG
jgi:F0F1-type ATP synthase membrane subunit b/b'